MFVLKGLLIFTPLFIFRLHFLAIINQKLVAACSMILIMIIAFSPFSFIGWFFDYVLFFMGATIILFTLLRNWSKTMIIIIRFLALLVFSGYVILNTLFGARLSDKYKNDGLTFRLYRVPDMVLSDTHRLRIDQTWGPFEKTVFHGQVQWTECTTFDYNLNINKLFIENNCK
jgi:hypothetical protein